MRSRARRTVGRSRRPSERREPAVVELAGLERIDRVVDRLQVAGAHTQIGQQLEQVGQVAGALVTGCPRTVTPRWQPGDEVLDGVAGHGRTACSGQGSVIDRRRGQAVEGDPAGRFLG